MTKEKISCVKDISKGLPIKVGLELHNLTVEYNSEAPFRKSVNKAALKFLMVQYEKAQDLIDQDDKNAAKLVMYFIDQSLAQAEEMEERLTPELDSDELTKDQVFKMFEEQYGIKVEYESEKLHDSRRSKETSSIDTTAKHH